MSKRSAHAACLLACALMLLSAPAAARDEGPTDVDGEALISLQLVDTDVRDALRLVSQQTGVDIVLSNAVGGVVTLELNQASLTETLEAIMKVSGLEYTIVDSIITVSTLDELLDLRRKRDELSAPSADGLPFEAAPEMDMRLFRLSYVDAERVRSMIEPMLSEQGRISVLQSPDQMAQSLDDDQDVLGQQADLQIGGRLSTSSQGQPAKSHTLVVSDFKDRLARVAEIIEEVDVRPPQVLIEARFVEVQLGKDDKMGIDWNMVVRATGGAAPTTFPFGNSSLGSFDPNVAGGSPGGIFPSAPADVTTPGVPGLFTFGTLDFTAFTAILRMIRDDSRVQVVSNPRVLVRDRTTATILVGERFPILNSTVTDMGTVTEALDRYEPIGVQLEVTPSILDDEQVELIVRPSTSTVGQLVQGTTGIEVARINTRQIDTAVVALDRQTVVLGGLISTRSADTERKVPFLGDIPYLGWFFRSTSTQTERIDLVVFLTVSLMKEEGLSDDERELFDKTTFTPLGAEEGSDEPWWRELEYMSSDSRY